MVSEEDIASNIRLESGLKIWQALWRYRQPDVWCFTAPVKPRRDELPQVTFLRRPTTTSIPQSQGIYLGEEEKPRRLSIVPPPKPPRTDRAVLDEKRRRELEKQREKERKERNGNGSTAVLLEKPSTSQHLVHDQLPSPSTSAPCIVRSVSEYKTGESMTQARDRIAKSNTTNAFDLSPSQFARFSFILFASCTICIPVLFTFICLSIPHRTSLKNSISASDNSLQVLDEVDSALKFTEDGNSLSGVFCPSDAPLVNLHDICSGCSLENSENGYESTSVELICDRCHKPIFRDRLRPSGCQCRDTSTLHVVSRETPPVVLTRASTADDTASSSSQHTVIPARPPPKPSELASQYHTAETARAQPVHVPGPSTSSRIVDATGSTDDDLEDCCQPDPMVATVLDVAVIRALLITHWQEQGIYWAMRYLLNRLEQIQVCSPFL
ncbi:hypothetical protein COOONC_02663 [Cooperia oncophora]